MFVKKFNSKKEVNYLIAVDFLNLSTGYKKRCQAPKVLPQKVGSDRKPLRGRRQLEKSPQPSRRAERDLIPTSCTIILYKFLFVKKSYRFSYLFSLICYPKTTIFFQRIEKNEK